MSLAVIQVTDSVLEKCTAFAKARMEGSKQLYRIRGELNDEKMKEDLIIGAIAEFAVYKLLKSKIKGLSKPDLKIYEKKKKSFSPDLQSDQACVHVKAQTEASAKAYGTSWLFQRTDKIFSEERKNEYLCLCVVKQNRDTEILAIVKLEDLKRYKLLKKPKVPRYKLTKVAIYAEDLLNSGIEINRLVVDL
ncbi:MAG: hypothetical protein FMNOHCHN_03754 [Ignavibacteriaceae bacterium]|nr:hypothetical protein [Ignavibacteriaceae bacterium]